MLKHSVKLTSHDEIQDKHVELTLHDEIWDKACKTDFT